VDAMRVGIIGMSSIGITATLLHHSKTKRVDAVVTTAIEASLTLVLNNAVAIPVIPPNVTHSPQTHPETEQLPSICMKLDIDHAI